MLEQIPPPNQLDQEHRAARAPINRDERIRFFGRYSIGLGCLIMIVVMLTLFRSVRDDYAAEIWEGFGVDEPGIFAKSEFFVALVTVFVSGILILVKNNYKAFLCSMFMVAAGFIFAMATTLSYWNTSNWTQPMAFQFMVQIGICLYVPYVLFHTTIFERLLAVLRDKSNIGYLMYLADFAGYISTVILMCVVSLIAKENINFVGLLMWLALIICPISIAGTMIVVIFFNKFSRSDCSVLAPAPKS